MGCHCFFFVRLAVFSLNLKMFCVASCLVFPMPVQRAYLMQIVRVHFYLFYLGCFNKIWKSYSPSRIEIAIPSRFFHFVHSYLRVCKSNMYIRRSLIQCSDSDRSKYIKNSRVRTRISLLAWTDSCKNSYLQKFLCIFLK